MIIFCYMTNTTSPGMQFQHIKIHMKNAIEDYDKSVIQQPNGKLQCHVNDANEIH